MQIDWFTVAAQIVNFLILVYLLKRFLYGPIINAMERREQNLEEQQDKADEEMQAATQLIKQYQEKQKALAEQQSQLLVQVQQEVECQRTEMLVQLRAEIKQKRRDWLSNLSKEQNSMMKDIGSLFVEQIITIRRRVIGDLAGVELEERMMQLFMRKLKQLPEQESKQLAQAINNASEIKVVSGFAINQKDSQQIKQCLTRIRPGLKVKFEQRAEIVCGILMETHEQIWSWNVNNYLDQLDKSLADIVAPLQGNT
jgi:F-type H+-transporting ATPase subunit b